MGQVGRTTAGTVALDASSGSRAVLGAIGASILGFGKAVLAFPLVALRAIETGLLFLVAKPVGLTITELVLRV
ncbi:hypothetical protein GGQ91_004856 [Methylobacterium fujisawaense]|uniref:Uncharacterized protein n=1 Tax=Methylobacterium fujisawaense TaxID=107400 RepID=A0ABR6DJF8_9HYPH|nr:hypothetical protein [Methylobacterium fujisawaense]MBA9065439.1 hypothetical protein [Methylobacterium fujisawaense]